MQQIGIHAERRLAALVPGDRDLVLLGEFQQFRPAGQVPFAPRRDDLDVRLQRVIAQLESHLVIPFAGRAVRHGIGADLFGDLDLALRDQRPGDRGAQQYCPSYRALARNIGNTKSRTNVFAQVVDENLLHPEQLGLSRAGSSSSPWPRSAVNVTTSQ